MTLWAVLLCGFAGVGPVWSVDVVRKDAGDVWRGDKAKFRFAVTNRGDRELRINVHPTCGCTIATADTSVEPGREGGIEVVLSTSQFLEAVEKEIEVETNDPSQPFATLSVAANVRPAATVSPGDRIAVDLPDRGRPSTRLTVRFLRDPSSKVSKVVSHDRLVSAVVTSGRSVELRYSAQTPCGLRRTTADVYAAGAEEPIATIAVATRKGICVSPASVYLGRLSPSTAGRPVLVLLDRVSGKFRILSASVGDRHLEVRVVTTGASANHRLSLTYRGGWAEGLVRRNLLVRTNDPLQPRLVIPVTGYVGE